MKVRLLPDRLVIIILVIKIRDNDRLIHFELRMTVDYILFLTLDPSLAPSPNEVSDTKWVSKAELEEFFSDSCKFFLFPPHAPPCAPRTNTH